MKIKVILLYLTVLLSLAAARKVRVSNKKYPTWPAVVESFEKFVRDEKFKEALRRLEQVTRLLKITGIEEDLDKYYAEGVEKLNILRKKLNCSKTKNKTNQAVCLFYRFMLDKAALSSVVKINKQVATIKNSNKPSREDCGFAPNTGVNLVLNGVIHYIYSYKQRKPLDKENEIWIKENDLLLFKCAYKYINEQNVSSPLEYSQLSNIKYLDEEKFKERLNALLNSVFKAVKGPKVAEGKALILRKIMLEVDYLKLKKDIF